LAHAVIALPWRTLPAASRGREGLKGQRTTR
jgi:hypothetical protein